MLDCIRCPFNRMTLVFGILRCDWKALICANAGLGTSQTYDVIPACGCTWTTNEDFMAKRLLQTLHPRVVRNGLSEIAPEQRPLDMGHIFVACYTFILKQEDAIICICYRHIYFALKLFFCFMIFKRMNTRFYRIQFSRNSGFIFD